MVRALIFSLFFIIPAFGWAQKSSDVVKWKYSYTKENGNYLLQFNATIDEGWHLYSQHLEGDGPIPTTFIFKESKHSVLVGNVVEPKPHTMLDPNFDMEISYFEGTTVFTQEVKRNSDHPVEVKGTIEFMVCNDHMCYPPETVEFTINIP